MSAKGLEFLANTIAAGFRAMKAEFRGHRVALGQLQEAVVAYDRKTSDNHALHGKRLADLEADLREVKRKALT